MNGPGKVFWEKCFQGFGDFFDMNGSGSKLVIFLSKVFGQTIPDTAVQTKPRQHGPV